MKLRRPRRTVLVRTTAAVNIRTAPRQAARLSRREPWTEARVNETYARAISKIRDVLAEKGATVVPGSPLHEYVVALAALSDDDLAAAICGDQGANRLRTGCSTLESPVAFGSRRRPH